MPKVPDLPERIPFEKLSRVPHGAPERLPFKLVGFRPPKRGQWFASGAIPQGYLAANDIPSPYWIVEPILNDAQRRDFRVQDWWKVAEPLTIWLRRDGRRAVQMLNPDRKYAGEFLIDTAFGRAALCAVLVSMSDAGYRIVREDTGQFVDPQDYNLWSLRWDSING